MTQTPSSSDHFRRGRFFNPGTQPQRFSHFMKWIIRRKIGYWPPYVDSAPGPRPAAKVEGEELVATFVNHSTVLLQTRGINFLTDPVWSKRVSPVSFLGPRRHRHPGIVFEDLPEIHCILISHNHYDHLDLPTLKKLAARKQPAVFCPLGTGKLLRQAGLRHIHELDWWGHQPWEGLRIHCVPAQHFSARTPFDRNKALWCGWVVEDATGNIYFAGDTGFGDHFSAIKERFEPMRLALLPIGAYKPEWFMGPIHMTPEEAVAAHEVLGASTAVAIHFGTFPLADDGLNEPSERLDAALNRSIPSRPILVLQEGEGRSIPAHTTAKSRGEKELLPAAAKPLQR